MTNQWLTWMNSSNKRQARSQMPMDASLRALGILGLGAGLMYFLDPNRGRRRRALVRDQIVHGVNLLGDAASVTTRDLNHRLHGLVAESSHLFKQEEVADDVLSARVRSKLGRAVSHPHAIAVTVNQGSVTLSGPVLADEEKHALKCVAKVPGVRDVENLLVAHTQAADIPGLQGDRRSGYHWALARTNWSPTTRLLACVTGGALMSYCLKRRDLLAESLGTLGFGLFVRGLTNLDAKHTFGIGAGARAVVTQKTININAPVARVYEFFTNHQNFPRFMTNVREARTSGNGRSHWIVAGPLGLPIEWTAQVTENIPHERITWETVPGSLISHCGTVQFRPNRHGGTQVDIRLCYNPVAGALGHALAKLFGAAPKSEMDADLLRMKTMIETGHAAHDAARPASTTSGMPSRTQEQRFASASGVLK